MVISFRKTILNPANSITIKPVGGLGNRLFALSSTLALGQQLKKQVCIAWFADQYLGATFESLFEIKDNQLCLTNGFFLRLEHKFKTALKLLKTADRRSFEPLIVYKSRVFFSTLLMKIIYRTTFTDDISVIKQCQYSRIYIISCEFFLATPLANLSYLRPIQSIQTKIDKIKAEMDVKHLIGVHIRRGDRAATHNSPTKTFIKQMQNEIEKDPMVQFFLASDNQWEKQNLKEIFGKRIITYDAQLLRGNLEGMQDAVVELYLLGAGKCIIGSESTYGQQASMLRNIPIYYVIGDSAYKLEQLHQYNYNQFEFKRLLSNQ